MPNFWPWTNLHELNLDWIIQSIKDQETRLTNFVSLNSIKYANPFQWSITSQYAQNTLVIDPQDGTAYLSIQPVPQGVQITDTEYWTPVFTLQNFIDPLKEAICRTIPQQEDGQAATQTIPANSLFFVGDILCTNSAEIPNTSLVIVGSNCTQISVAELIQQSIAAETTAREQADRQLSQQIGAEVSAREQADQQLSQQIGAEVSAREQADQQLSQQIGAALSLGNVVVIGDSYGTGEIGPVTGWPSICASYLGMLVNENFFIKCTGGAGFSPSGEKNYATMVTSLASTMQNTQKTAVTLVLFTGGLNDTSGVSEENVSAAISAAKMAFPNARIAIATVGWSTDPVKTGAIANTVLPVYQACGKYGAYYVQNSEYILHNYTWLQSDGIHPTQEGVNHIATEMAQAILSGVCCGDYPLGSFTFTDGAYFTTNISGVCRLTGGVLSLFFTNPLTFEQKQQVPLLQWIDVGQINCDYLSALSNIGYMPVVVTGFMKYNNTLYTANAACYVAGKHLYMMIMADIQASGPVDITNFSVIANGARFPALYC